jgi:flagellar motility protein MotE (MotC chaperone)
MQMRSVRSKIGLGIAAGAVVFGALGSDPSIRPARAQPGVPAPDSRKEEVPKAKDSRSSFVNMQQYCSNIVAAAAAAQNARQEKRLVELEQEIGRRLEELESKRAELQELLDRQDAFSRKANDALVAIYGRMRADAAAAQLANMDEELAAAVLLRLKPKIASRILNEFEAPRAVALSRKISSISTSTHSGKKP